MKSLEQQIDEARIELIKAQNWYDNSFGATEEKTKWLLENWANKEKQYKELMFQFTSKLD